MVAVIKKKKADEPMERIFIRSRELSRLMNKQELSMLLATIEHNIKSINLHTTIEDYCEYKKSVKKRK